MRCSTPRPSARQLSRNVSTTSAGGSDSKEHDTRQTVAAEAIGDVDRQALFGQALDFRRGAADTGGIHLVGALRELGNAVHLRRLHRCDPDIEFERREEIFQAGGGALGACALRALDVHVAAAAVFLGDAGAVEGPDVGQEIGDFGGARGQCERQRLGSAGLHFLDLLRTVVHQDESVQADFELAGERRQVAGLGVPVDALRREIREAQRHFRMGAEGCGRRRLRCSCCTA